MTTNLKPHKQRRPDHYPSYVIDVLVPEGKMFVFVAEDNDENIVSVHAHIGKAGALVQAWANGMCEFISFCLVHKRLSLSELIIILSGNSSDQSRRQPDGISVKSGVDGIVYALQYYKKVKYAEFLATQSDITGMARRVG